MGRKRIVQHDPPRVTTSISLYANSQYVRALRIVAAERGTTVGKMVREVIDSRYGNEIDAVLPRVQS